MRTMRNPLTISRAKRASTITNPILDATPAEASIVDSFTKMYQANERLLELVSTLAAERGAARDVCAYYAEQIVEMKVALEACMLNDGTARYDYGEPRGRDGNRPRAGHRWATPHEIAKEALS